MKTRSEPFRLVDGRLHVEDVDLCALAAELEGRAAWVLSHAALREVLARQIGTCTVAVGQIGPPAVLLMFAEAGCWARAASSHELSLAMAAGFTPAHIVAGAPVLDDGFIKDALTAGVGLLLRPDRDVALNVARIAGALELRQPAAEGGPPEVPADAFTNCGGLLAPLLSAPPDLALDAPWERCGRAQPRVLALREPPYDELPSASAAAGRRRAANTGQKVRLRGLGAKTGVPARLVGHVERGDWVLVPAPDAVSVRLPHPAWPAPPTVLVREQAWRLLDPRPLPDAD
ncbi:MAG: hypothetical protein ACYTG2_03865 [Planctomycetota bacterium]